MSDVRGDASTSGPGRGGAAGSGRVPGGSITSLILARIDRLGWAPFHTRMVLALGAAWVLDGIEITIAGAIAAVLTEKATLDISSTQAGAIATVYLLGGVFGALFFGRRRTLSDVRTSSWSLWASISAAPL